MESGAIGAVAHAAGVPFVVVRVVVDGHDDQLPESIEAWVTSAGQTRVAPLARALLAPRELGMFTILLRRSWVAQRALRQLARVLVPANFCCARESDREHLN
jgi:hypothetical protein